MAESLFINGGLSPAFLVQLRAGLIEHVKKTSRAAQSSTVVTSTYADVDVPILADDVDAVWTAEGQEIAQAAPDLVTKKVRPGKLARIVPISNEAIMSQQIDLIQMTTRSLGRSFVDQADRAFYNLLAAPAPQGGLASITAPTEIAVGATAFPNLDAVYEAAGVIATAGGVATDLHVNVDTLVALQTLKKSSGSNEGLLEGDAMRNLMAGTATGDLAVTVAGLALRVSRHVPAGTAWVTDRTKIVTALTGQPKFDTSQDAGFTRDVTLIRATQGLGYVVADEVAGAVRLDLTV
ncbi:phage major capsid protein [Dietzia sp. oral taxon 368]|uniref:phage major capsid protein n=1 Tax=Dietzia sp. oral taxon 368 TaxID=712270 RepID=UPI000D09031F|nr:phage major capsid protein [Dietzia sp. oral taxon 368]AVM65394.1 phage major capsid protein [Dietzia sp. oral taxon 368]